MILKFAAQGSPELWLASSIDALENSGFYNIEYEPGYNQVSGFYDGPMTVRTTLGADGNTMLELITDSEENLALYKDQVVSYIAYYQSRPEQELYIKISSPVGRYKLLTEEPPEKGSITLAEAEQSLGQDIEPVADESTSSDVFEKPEDITQGRPLYKTTWFVLLICILVPPLGIYLLWKSNAFYERDRKIFTVFFSLYTILWLWLLYILLVPGSTKNLVPEVVDESGSKLDQINAYWSQESITNFNSQMPELISSYDNLFLNSQLGTAEGNAQAEAIYNQVQTLSEAAMNVGQLASDNAAYTIQEKINSTSELFISAIGESRNALASGDINQINNSMMSWTMAENSFYEIAYIYNSAIQMSSEDAAVETGTVMINY